MKYDFTSITDRHGKDSIAVDALTGSGFAPAPPKDGFDIIPMWVADMNFSHCTHCAGSYHKADTASFLRIFLTLRGIF